MLRFSANNHSLLSRTEYRSCAVFMVLGHSTHRVYRLHDFTKAHAMEPGSYYCVSGKVNSADKLYWWSNRSNRVPNTTGFPALLFLLTARENNQME